MNIGIIGAGQIGATLTAQYRNAGHTVRITNASGIKKLKSLETATGATAVPLPEIVQDIDILVIAVPFCAVPALSQEIADKIDKGQS